MLSPEYFVCAKVQYRSVVCSKAEHSALWSAALCLDLMPKLDIRLVYSTVWLKQTAKNRQCLSHVTVCLILSCIYCSTMFSRTMSAAGTLLSFSMAHTELRMKCLSTAKPIFLLKLHSTSLSVSESVTIFVTLLAKWKCLCVTKYLFKDKLWKTLIK